MASAAAAKPLTAPNSAPKRAGWTVRGVEAFAAGQHRDGGTTYTESDLDDIVRNYHLNKATFRPPLVIGHSEDQEMFSDTGIPKWGEIDNPRRQGKTLLVDLVNLPEKLAEWINDRRYDAVSAEVYPNPAKGTTGYGKMFRRLAVLGGYPPELKQLANLPPAKLETYGEFSNLKPVKFLTRNTRKLPNGNFEIFSEVSAMPPPNETDPNGNQPPDHKKTLVEQHGVDPQIAQEMPDHHAAHICDKMGEKDAAKDAEPGPDMPEDEAMGFYDDNMKKYAEGAHKRFGQKFAERAKSILSKFAEDPDKKKDDDMKPEQFAEQIKTAVKEAVAAEIGQIKATGNETLKHLAEERASAKKLSVETFCEQMLKEGRVIPAQLDDSGKKPSIKKLLLLADAVTPVEGFSENGKPLTPFDLLKQEIASRPVLNRGELLKGRKPGDAADEELAKVERFAEQPEIVDVLKASGKSSVAYVEEFKAAKKKLPSLTAALYGVPETV